MEYVKLQFIWEASRSPHQKGEGRSPSKRGEAGSAEGGLERLGARGSARRFIIEKSL